MIALLVEDDEDKRHLVLAMLRKCYGDWDILVARSLYSGIQALRRVSFDLLIADMSIPTFDIAEGEDGGRPQAFGGRELMRHLVFREVMVAMLVLTQFDQFGEGREAVTLAELDLELRCEFGASYLGAVYYDASGDRWRDHLKHTIDKWRQGGV